VILAEGTSNKEGKMIWLMITSLIVTGSVGILALCGVAPVDIPVLGWILMYVTVINFIIIMSFRQRIAKEEYRTKMFESYVIAIGKRAREVLYPGFSRRGHFAAMDSFTQVALKDIDEDCRKVLSRYSDVE